MPNSMTGYGRGEFATDDRRVTVEIKSINNRYCDVQIRLPRVLNALEGKVRDLVTNRLARGKIEVSIAYADNRAQAYQVNCDLGLAKAYADALRQVAGAAGSLERPSASTIVRFNDVLRVEAAQVDPEETWHLLETAMQKALDNLTVMRAEEGSRLAADMVSRIERIEAERLNIAVRAPEVPVLYRERLQIRITELLGDRASALVDEQRLAAEIALYADKCSIDEELVRLKSHLESFLSILAEPDPVGKKLDFLVQEINREINTIGSKANDLQLTDRVVFLKSELEKIREQVQNLE
ncbi:MAG TPA: YicC family protein [Clostridiales bacterium]|nr:YicC family protein [Clostridiales bacterium]